MSFTKTKNGPKKSCIIKRCIIQFLLEILYLEVLTHWRRTFWCFYLVRNLSPEYEFWAQYYTDGVFVCDSYWKYFYKISYAFSFENHTYVALFWFQYNSFYCRTKILLFNHHLNPKKPFCAINQRRGHFSELSPNIHHTYARWKGTGEPLSNLSLKIVKNFPPQIWKIFCILISLCTPLSYGIWILDLHPMVKTLAFLEHSVISIPKFCK